MSESRRRIAVLGSGLIGAAVVAALLESGRRVRTWGATPSWYLTAFTEVGASPSPSAGEAVTGAEVVVLAPADHAERITIEAELGGRLPGTSTVVTVREPSDDGQWSDAWSAREPHDRLDCVVFGDPAGIGGPSVVLLVSGDPALVDRHRALLDGLGVAIPVGDPSPGGRRTEIALVGLWYDVNVAVLRALANIEPSARTVLELELRAILSQLPSVIRSVDTGGPVRTDAGLALHARALETVNAARSRGGSTGSELEQAARHVAALMAREDPGSPLTRITGALRCDDGTTDPHPSARPA